MKNRTSFTEWCKLAGPGGPMLWVIDGIIERLACALERHSNTERAEYDENAEDLGFILFIFLAIPVTILIFVLLVS